MYSLSAPSSSIVLLLCSCWLSLGEKFIKMVLYKTSIVCKEGTNWSKTLQSKSCASCKMLAAGKRHNFYFEVHYTFSCFTTAALAGQLATVCREVDVFHANLGIKLFETRAFTRRFSVQHHIPLFNQSHIATDRKSQAVFFRYIFLYLAVVPRRSLALHDWILKSVAGLTNTTSIHVQINTIWWGKSH